MFSLLPTELAWRSLFIIGVLPALFVVFIRRFVKDPDIYQQHKAKEQKGQDEARFTEIFSPRLISTTLRATILTTGAQGGYYAITTWLPKTERHLTVLGRILQPAVH